MAMSLSLVVWAWACSGPPFCDHHSMEWSVSLRAERAGREVDHAAPRGRATQQRNRAHAEARVVEVRRAGGLRRGQDARQPALRGRSHQNGRSRRAGARPPVPARRRTRRRRRPAPSSAQGRTRRTEASRSAPTPAAAGRPRSSRAAARSARGSAWRSCTWSPSSCMRSGPSTSVRTTPASWARVSTMLSAPSMRSRDADAEIGVLLERLVQLVRGTASCRWRSGRRPRARPRAPATAPGPRPPLAPRRPARRRPRGRRPRRRRSACGKCRYSVPTPDAGLLGDGLHRRSAALLGEDLAGRGDQALVVALGVGPHGAAASSSSCRRRDRPSPSSTSVAPSSSCVPSRAEISCCKTEAPSVY